MQTEEEKAYRLILSDSELIKNNGLDVSNIQKRQYNYEITVKNGSDSVKLLIYFGKNGTKKVLQGNAGNKLYNDLNKLVLGNSLFDFTVNKIDEPEKYIGTDESGKGDYFGPLVVAAVFVNKNSLVKLKNIGVKDSKELTDNTIKKLAVEIERIVENKFDIISISPEKYNLLYTKIGNVNRILGWAHAKVLENLLNKTDAEEAISDKFGDENLIKDSLQKKGQKVLLHQFTKAEKYTAVAAASILARNSFCKWIEHGSKHSGIELPKGASTKVEEVALIIKNKFGEENLNQYVKLHFKTTKKII